MVLTCKVLDGQVVLTTMPKAETQGTKWYDKKIPFKTEQDFNSWQSMLRLLLSAVDQSRSVGGGSRGGNRSPTGIYFIQEAIGAAAFAAADEQGAANAQDADNRGKYPRAFLKHIGGLLNAHKLVANATNIAGQTAAFWGLYQNDEA